MYIVFTLENKENGFISLQHMFFDMIGMKLSSLKLKVCNSKLMLITLLNMKEQL